MASRQTILHRRALVLAGMVSGFVSAMAVACQVHLGTSLPSAKPQMIMGTGPLFGTPVTAFGSMDNQAFGPAKSAGGSNGTPTVGGISQVKRTQVFSTGKCAFGDAQVTPYLQNNNNNTARTASTGTSSPPKTLDESPTWHGLPTRGCVG